MAAVKFVTISAAKFGATGFTPDESTLYFIKDTQKLYKGATCFSGGVYETVTADPTGAALKVNTLFVNTTDGSVKYYDGNNLVTVVKPQPSAIGDGSVNALATTKAVVDYVAAKISEVNTTNQGLDNRLTVVEKKAAANETAIGTINGTGDGSISKAVADAKTELQGEINTAKSELKTKIDEKATKATTLAGYGIGDAYTKAEVDTAIANAHHLKREIVNVLPEVGAANEDTIYMVPKKAGVAGNESGNVYIEYMLINGKFEQIGDSTVDLTDYATKTYADEKAADAEKNAKADTLAKIQALDKTDTAATNQYVSSVSQTDGLISVTRVTLPVYSVATGTAQGTIAVNGKDVAVAGLGSAAFAATTDFDAKGAADTAAAGALSDAKAYAKEQASAAQTAAESKAAELATTVKGEAITSANTYTDTQVKQAKTDAAADAQKKANAAQVAAEATAAADATSKANAAQTAATTAAKTYTDDEVAKAKTAAATDAKTKADTAEKNAKAYADELLSWEDLG